MHPNAAFRGADLARNLDFARTQSFGILTLADPGGGAPMASHVPFLLSDDGAVAEVHLARPNPILATLDAPREALLIVAGPHGYVSPDWYGTPDQVPTWNYVAVHLRGTLTLLPDAVLDDLLDRQSAQFEDRLQPKTPWTADKMPEGLKARMMRAIRPVRLRIATVDGTWKLSQNKPAAVRMAAAGGVQAAGAGSETDALAAMMRAADD